MFAFYCAEGGARERIGMESEGISTCAGNAAPSACAARAAAVRYT